MMGSMLLSAIGHGYKKGGENFPLSKLKFFCPPTDRKKTFRPSPKRPRYKKIIFQEEKTWEKEERLDHD
jgi:hypothetical protein